MMKPNTTNIQPQIKQRMNKQNYQPGHNQMKGGNYKTPAGAPNQMKTAPPAGVSTNQNSSHLYNTSLANQNGTSGHVTQSQSHDQSHDGVKEVKPEQQQQQDSSNLANTKEKTPMCLINELARYNKELDSLLSDHFGRTAGNSQASFSQDIDDAGCIDSDNETDTVTSTVAVEAIVEERTRDYVQHHGSDTESSEEENNESEHDDVVESNGDLRKIKDFLKGGCGCKMNCHTKCSVDELNDHILNVRDMEKHEKELYIMGTLNDVSQDTTKRGKKRQRMRYTFRFCGCVVCKKTFLLCYDIGRTSLQNILTHVAQHGVTLRKHGNYGKSKPHSLKYEDVQRVVSFINNHADVHGIPQPATPRGRDNIPPVYLSAETTKCQLHKEYVASCSEIDPPVRTVKLSAFKTIWLSCLPHIRIASPRDDVCASCEKFRKAVADAVDEESKLVASTDLRQHILQAQNVIHQYTLVDEQGPAHKKTFYVKLQLGEKEEYSASGASIKKAQHAAAAMALEKTAFKHPPPKPHRSFMLTQEIPEGPNSITPTVELNALAMKRGEPAMYRNIENRAPPYYQQNYDFRGMYNQRYHMMRPPRIFYVSLKVGSREFIGEGPSRQQARHNAARKALEIIRMLPMPDTDDKDKQENGVTETNKDIETEGTLTDISDETKSEVSVVHEIALRHNLPVSFEVTRESGPPHMKTFITQCMVGTYKTEAEGNSKKLSKKRAADLMLRELQHLPNPVVMMRPKPKPLARKKNRNLIRMQKADPAYGVGINPISRLIQIQQAQKKKEPIYTLLAERGLPRRREFVMQIQVDEHTCTGVGPNKKLAKRHAAEAMLQLLGYSKPSPQPSKPAIKMQGDSSLGEKKVTFSDAADAANGTSSRQMVPGLIVLPEGNRNTYSQLKAHHNQYSGGIDPSTFGVRPEIRLKELCKRNNIEVKFDEFAGSNNPSEYLSRLMVATNPMQPIHGSGQTPEASRDAAALSALKILTDMGVLKDDRVLPSGDAPQIKG